MLEYDGFAIASAISQSAKFSEGRFVDGPLTIDEFVELVEYWEREDDWVLNADGHGMSLIH
ncbi:hypothetical protein IHQ71_28410 [Rhizobium sp. TH2]|uniref:hypothetical protein n=1 Tax=Rhizobium sp. TH2 TaxID=2775403 RepID=UPI0021570A2E|nr:hypothetical protein [Rhizobium sp. TH2]UVC08988.1 hypothetical protein IHQ71_28410 [Rhizobium sp. TH2]